MSTNNPEVVALLSKATTSFDEAKLLLDNNYYNTAVNRIYYACFYAINALLINRSITAKSHSGVKQMFGLHFVTPGIISKELGKFYTEIFEMRQEGDYEFFTFFEKEEVTVLLAPAQQLIKQIESILSKQ
jgi:uncharacterized protein (UPF0332 family)